MREKVTSDWEEANGRGFEGGEPRRKHKKKTDEKHNKKESHVPDWRKESRKRAARRNWSAVE